MFILAIVLRKSSLFIITESDNSISVYRKNAKEKKYYIKSSRPKRVFVVVIGTK